MLPLAFQAGWTGFVYFLKMSFIHIYYPPLRTVYKISFYFISQTSLIRTVSFLKEGGGGGWTSFIGENQRKKAPLPRRPCFWQLPSQQPRAAAVSVVHPVSGLQVVSLSWQAFTSSPFPEPFMNGCGTVNAAESFTKAPVSLKATLGKETRCPLCLFSFFEVI